MTTDKKPSERLRPLRDALTKEADRSWADVAGDILDEHAAKLNALMPKQEPKPNRECLNCGSTGPHYVPPSMGEPGFFTCNKPTPTPAPSGRAERARVWAEKMIQGPGYLSVGPNHPRGYSELSNSVFLAEQTPKSMGFAQASCARWLTAFAAAEVAEVEMELLRVRTTGHGAAHELDNIAVECGLGHSPAAGTVAAHVRKVTADRDQLRLRVEAAEKVIARWDELEAVREDSGEAEVYGRLLAAKSALAKLAEGGGRK